MCYLLFSSSSDVSHVCVHTCVLFKGEVWFVKCVCDFCTTSGIKRNCIYTSSYVGNWTLPYCILNTVHSECFSMYCMMPSTLRNSMWNSAHYATFQTLVCSTVVPRPQYTACLIDRVWFGLVVSLTCCWLCSSMLSFTSSDCRASRKALRCLRSAM